MSDTEQPRSLTRKQFCEQEQISLTTFHKLRNAGLGPVEMRSTVMKSARITPEAARDWELMMEKESQTTATKLEDVRRSELARVAGNKAALSPDHVSKRGKGKTPRAGKNDSKADTVLGFKSKKAVRSVKE
jgi:hypothetical protein